MPLFTQTDHNPDSGYSSEKTANLLLLYGSMTRGLAVLPLGFLTVTVLSPVAEGRIDNFR